MINPHLFDNITLEMLLKGAVNEANRLVESMKDSPVSRQSVIRFHAGFVDGFAAAKGWVVPMWFTSQCILAAYYGTPMKGCE